MLADVVLPSRRFQVFTYQVPSQLLSSLHVGSQVVVPLGSVVVSGLVARLFEEQLASSLPGNLHHTTLRAILSLETESENPPLGHNLFRLVEKISSYYLAPLSACLRLIVPPHSVKVIRRVYLTEDGHAAVGNPSLADEAQVVLRKLTHAPKGLLRSSLLRTLPNASTTLTRLKKKGWIMERSTVPSGSKATSRVHVRTHKEKPMVPVLPGLFDFPEEVRAKEKNVSDSLQGARPYSFMDSQIWERLADALDAGDFRETSVVGSALSRQHWLIQAAKRLELQGRRAMVLTPEVHQAEALAGHLRSIWGEEVEVYHGHLSPSVRSARWERIRQGDVKVVVGTRSALFLPIPDLGLVWVEQEEDSSYKDEHLPYYHGRKVAQMRGEVDQALVVYGAIWPSLETYGQFHEQVNLTSEPSGLEGLHIELVDLRSLPYGTMVSPALKTSMTGALEEGEQVIVLLNRKGFSRSLICRDCGQAPSCSACGVAMKLFQRPSRLVCSYCGGRQVTPEICPTCHGTVFRFSGMGTQRLEEEIAGLFPSFPIGRFDRDNIKTFQEASNMLHQFRQQNLRILIGTEFLLHQVDPPTAKVVGLPQAELGLHIPDFRSAERTFQILSKAVTLARDDQQLAEVILQTNLPDHHVLVAITQQNPQVFYDQELELRTTLGYPPVTHVILLVVQGTNETRVQGVTDFLGQRLKGLVVKKASGEQRKGMLGLPMVLGPIASKKPGGSKKHRLIFLIKTDDLLGTQCQIRQIQHEFNVQFSKDSIVFEVNVDPIEIQ